jgi:hypothetical protein
VVAEGPVLVATSTAPDQTSHRLEIRRPFGRTDFWLELDQQEAALLAERIAAGQRHAQQEQKP